MAGRTLFRKGHRTSGLAVQLPNGIDARRVWFELGGEMRGFANAPRPSRTACIDSIPRASALR
jgi:hypothetical protein